MKQWLCILIGCLITFFASAQSVQPLPVDQAFQVSIKGISNNQLQLEWKIAPGYHLYRDRFTFKVVDPKKAAIAQINLPVGISKHDDILGDYQVYENTIDITVPFTSIENKQAELLIGYQGCSDSNFCYPPVTKKITVNFSNLSQMAISDSGKAITPYSLQDKITRLLEQRNYFLICLAFIGFGLLLAFTPCVLPMIPILSGIIVGQDREDLTTRRAFLLSLSYVIGMALTYAIAGVLVAMAGSHLAEAFQAPWVIVIFSLLFILLALSLFGFFELRLPHFIHHRIVSLSHKQRSGSFIGAFVMGALSVLVVSPCVTAPLVGALTFIAQTGDVVLGSAALFALGLGMGIPLLIIGTTEGKLLPKSGAWMNVVKSAFGVLLIASAIYLLQRILPGSVCLLLWAALFIILAVYLGVDGHNKMSSGWVKFGKGLGLLAFCYGVILLVGASLGNSDPFQPLAIHGIKKDALISTPTTESGLRFAPVDNFDDVQKALQLARQQNRIVMLDFYADWCVSCHEMARTTFADPQVKAALNNVMLIQADVTANNAYDRILENYYGVVAPPTILFFDTNGKELKQYRIVGAVSPEDFLAHIQAMRSQGIKC